MKKSDIKNGMHVITNNNTEYIIISGVEASRQIQEDNVYDIIMVRLHDDGWMPFDNYDDNLRYNFNHDYDIKEVYAPQFYAYLLLSVHEYDTKFVKVWERTKKMTKAEIEKILGYNIEIVN